MTLCAYSRSILRLLHGRRTSMTRGESSSVTAETAVNLTESVFFTVGVRLKREGIPDRAAELLRDISVEKLFDEGMDDIRRMMTAAKRLQRSVTEKTFFDTPECILRRHGKGRHRRIFQAVPSAIRCARGTHNGGLSASRHEPEA